MSTWRVGEEPPKEYLDLLYEGEGSGGGSDEEVDVEDEVDLEDEEVQEDEDEDEVEAPPYSPLSSPESRERLGRMSRMDDPTTSREVRERSRSPLSSSAEPLVPAEYVEVMFDEFGVQLDEQPTAVPAEGLVVVFDEFGVALDEQPTVDEFFAPDTHPLYVLGERERDERNRRGTSGRRGGRRGVRGVRGQSTRGGRYPSRGRRGGRQWVVGEPLHQIWLSDADVPPELVSLATDVVRRRQRRSQGDAVADTTERGRVASESEDEFVDASDGGDGPHRLERQNPDFEWYPMEECKYLGQLVSNELLRFNPYDRNISYKQ